MGTSSGILFQLELPQVLPQVLLAELGTLVAVDVS
jgi:hypothetical protein